MSHWRSLCIIHLLVLHNCHFLSFFFQSLIYELLFCTTIYDCCACEMDFFFTSHLRSLCIIHLLVLHNCHVLSFLFFQFLICGVLFYTTVYDSCAYTCLLFQLLFQTVVPHTPFGAAQPFFSFLFISSSVFLVVSYHVQIIVFEFMTVVLTCCTTVEVRLFSFIWSRSNYCFRRYDRCAYAFFNAAQPSDLFLLWEQCFITFHY